MAGKLTRMSKIKQVLQLHREGFSNRRIASHLGLYKETVNGYIRKIKDCNFDIDSLLKQDDPILEKTLSAGSPAYTEDRFHVFKDKIPHFESELRRPHVKRYTLWEEYIKEHPDGYRYSQFCYHLKQMIVARHPSAILEHFPGKELQIDFAGDTLFYVDPETGEKIKVQVFIACLPYSGYSFAKAVLTQNTEDFLYALSCALQYFGGCPKILIPDNLKSAVIKADRYEPDLNKALEDFGNHYDFTILPARVRKPKDKASVENLVNIIYSRVYAKLRNMTFFSIEELNEAIEEKVREHNQTRMQQKGYSREEKFLAEEKKELKTLPESGFELKYYAALRVAVNNCIYLGRDKHYYSVPYAYIGQETSVIYTRTLVSVYCDGKLIATHPRKIGYGYSIIKEHLCSTHQHYRERSPEYYIRIAEKRSEPLAVLIKRNFEIEEVPEKIYKRCDGLLSLQRKTDPSVFEKACSYALDNDIITYQSLRAIIEKKTYRESPEEENMDATRKKQEEEKRPYHENIRGREYYKNQINQQTSLWNELDQN